MACLNFNLLRYRQSTMPPHRLIPPPCRLKIHPAPLYWKWMIQYTRTGSLHDPAGYAGISQQRSDMENVFRLTPILLFLMKRSVIITPVSARFSQRSSAVGRFLLMLLPQKKRMVQNGCFSVQFSRKICRFSVPGGKKHHWTRLAVTGWNTFHCCYTIFDGILKRATMSRKHSGLFVTIWCEAVKELKYWSTWSISVTAPWRFCPIRTNIFSIPHQKCTGISFWIKSGYSQSDIFCHFRQKYRNTHRTKCYNKGFKTAGLSAGLSFIKL